MTLKNAIAFLNYFKDMSEENIIIKTAYKNISEKKFNGIPAKQLLEKKEWNDLKEDNKN